MIEISKTCIGRVSGKYIVWRRLLWLMMQRECDGPKSWRFHHRIKKPSSKVAGQDRHHPSDAFLMLLLSTSLMQSSTRACTVWSVEGNQHQRHLRLTALLTFAIRDSHPSIIQQDQNYNPLSFSRREKCIKNLEIYYEGTWTRIPICCRRATTAVYAPVLPATFE